MNEPLPKPKKSWVIRLLNPFVAIPLTLLILLLCAPFAYRGYKLSLVPDPGEPFDVAAFIKASHVDDADNARKDFEHAISLLPYPSYSSSDYEKFHEEVFTAPQFSAEANKYVKYIERTEPALLAWKKGTEKSDYSGVSLIKINLNSASMGPYSVFPEGYRRIMRLLCDRALINWRDKKYEESINWYLVSFRSSQLIQKNGGYDNRHIAGSFYGLAVYFLTKQIYDQKIPKEFIEELLIEIEKINNDIYPLSDTLKVEYLLLKNSEELIASWDLDIYDDSSIVPCIYFTLGEPELLLRLSRQWFGNVLPEIDRPRYERSSYPCKSEECILYYPALKKGSNKRQMTPAEIDAMWTQSPLIFLNRPGKYHFDDFDDESVQRKLFVTVLKLEIYRRRHGKYPEKLKDVYPNQDLPADDFDSTGSPLRYVRDANQSCRIWSVALDGTDDGGFNLADHIYKGDFGYQLGGDNKKTLSNE